MACSGIGLVLISSVGTRREMIVQSVAIVLGILLLGLWDKFGPKR